MIVYRTFHFLQHNFGPIFFATTCGTNTGHVTRMNYELWTKRGAINHIQLRARERWAFPNCCVRTLLPAEGLPDCSGYVTNSLFMSLFVCLLDVIFVAACDHFRSIHDDMLLYRIWSYSTSSKSLFHYYLPLLSNLIRNTQRCVTLEGKQGTFHLYDVKFPSRPTPLWLI